MEIIRKKQKQIYYRDKGNYRRCSSCCPSFTVHFFNSHMGHRMALGTVQVDDGAACPIKCFQK